MVLIFRNHPLLNTMVSYTIVWTAADISEQKLISKKKHMDFDKTVRMAIIGTLFVAPLIFSWLRLADKLFPGASMKNVAKKVITEQIFFSPVAIAGFYASSNIIEGRLDFREELREKYFKTWKTGLTFWPVVQTVNQALVPHLYKPVFVVSASFVWSNFLCLMKERNAVSVDAEDAQISH